jgi:hypothetical protein
MVCEADIHCPCVSTRRSTRSHVGIAVLDLHGALALSAAYPGQVVTLAVCPLSRDALETRLQERGGTLRPRPFQKLNRPYWHGKKRAMPSCRWGLLHLVYAKSSNGPAGTTPLGLTASRLW